MRTAFMSETPSVQLEIWVRAKYHERSRKCPDWLQASAQNLDSRGRCLYMNLLALGIWRRGGENPQAVHDGGQGKIEILVAIAEQDRAADILGQVPERDMGLGIDDREAQLSEHGESEAGIGEVPAYFEYSIGVSGR